MNAIASRPVSGSFQLPLTEASPTRRLVLRALEAGECLSCLLYTSFPNIKFVEMLIHPRSKLLAIRPCSSETKNKVQWSRLKDGQPIPCLLYTSRQERKQSKLFSRYARVIFQIV